MFLKLMLTSFSSSQTTNQPAANTSTPAAPGASSHAQIDITHLRSTTKFDQLTPDLQKEIENVDTLILNQIRLASEVSDLLPIVSAAGKALPNDVDFVSQKLDEVEVALGNDAEAIVAAREGDLKKGELEAKCVFRAIDRLKMPRQYQVGHTQNESLTGSGIYGGAGLSGWWNNPQTLRGSVRSGNAQGDTIQLPGEDAEETQGPKSLVELFNLRTAEMQDKIQNDRQLLGEVEDFVQGLEDKVVGKERDLYQRLNYGDRTGSVMSERDHQIQLLRYVFGEVQRSLYDVADKVGAARDEVSQLSLGR
jgi:nucleoporin p58/p45